MLEAEGSENMTLGIDGVILLAITASAIAWAKRGDVVEDRVFRLVKLCSGSDETAKKVAQSVAERFRTPSMLLPGFDVRHDDPDCELLPNVPHRFACGSMHLAVDLPRSPSELNSNQRRAVAQHHQSLLDVLEWLACHSQWEGAARLFTSYTDHCRASNEAVAPEAVKLAQRALQQSSQHRQAAALAVQHDVLPDSVDDLCALVANAPAAGDSLGRLLSTIVQSRRVGSPSVQSALLTAACSRGSTDASQLQWQVAFRVFGIVNGAAPSGGPYPIRNVFHLLLPAACAVDKPQAAAKLLRHAMRREPNCVEELLLKCLHFDLGKELAYHVVRRRTWQKDKEVHVDDSACTPLSASPGGGRMHLTQLALLLFHRSAVPRNANTLLEVLPVDEALPRLAVNAVTRVMPLLTDEDTECISSTVASRCCWKTAIAVALALQTGCRRATSSAFLALAAPVCRQGRWNEALALATAAFTQRRSAVSTASITRRISPTANDEYSMCVFAAYAAGRTAAGNFWLDRAHSEGIRFSPQLYDHAIHASAAGSWASAVSVLRSARRAGAVCTETGIEDILRAAERDHMTHDALRAIWASEGAKWVP